MHTGLRCRVEFLVPSTAEEEPGQANRRHAKETGDSLACLQTVFRAEPIVIRSSIIVFAFVVVVKLVNKNDGKDAAHNRK